MPASNAMDSFNARGVEVQVLAGRGDVDVAAHLGELNGMLHERLGAVQMGRQEMADGDLGLLHHADHRVHPPRAFSIKVHESGLAAQHAADPRLGRDAAKLLEARL